jgi:hypothetical protein|tara:strand:+ start:432 stop:785 length:354 start_codon:yes stop_codon:yes gene_type:complete
MVVESKLRSFQVENLSKYAKFREIQQSRNKKIGQRLNELIDKEVKEADPQFKELTAIRSKDAPDIIVPNPFVLDQFHSIPKWIEYMQTLTKKEHEELYLHLIALKNITREFEDYRLD